MKMTSSDFQSTFHFHVAVATETWRCCCFGGCGLVFVLSKFSVFMHAGFKFSDQKTRSTWHEENMMGERSFRSNQALPRTINPYDMRRVN